MIANYDLSKVLADKGATQSQINSATAKMCAEAIADGAVDGLGLARGQVDALMRKVDSVEDGIDARIARASQAESRLASAVSRADAKLADVNARVDELGTMADSITVSDDTLRDAVNVYTLILTRTKQVLGDDALTEAVIVQLLETASYGLWRSIMGPKEADKKPAPKYYR